MPIEGGTLQRISIPFIVNVAGATLGQDGVLVDAAGENAETYFTLPYEATRIKRIIIYAKSIVAEADHMRLDIYINGGSDNENYATHGFSSLSQNSFTVNFAANDVLTWVLDNVTYPNLLWFTGGDTLSIAALYRAAVGVDCATNARFRVALIEWE